MHEREDYRQDQLAGLNKERVPKIEDCRVNTSSTRPHRQARSSGERVIYLTCFMNILKNMGKFELLNIKLV